MGCRALFRASVVGLSYSATGHRTGEIRFVAGLKGVHEQMSSLWIRGGIPLRGDVRISGAKNSALPVMVAACLAEEESVLGRVPMNRDVLNMCHVLNELGASAWFDEQNDLHVDGSGLSSCRAPYKLVRKMRASFYVSGLLLARLARAEVPLPGGCALGSRPVDFHIAGFRKLGCCVRVEHGYMIAERVRLSGERFCVNRASVGTTVNMMLAASLAEGTTILENAAREPEVVDLAVCMNAMGARIRGAGTDVIRIDGVKRLRGVEYRIIPDRIEAGTYILAAGITGGEVTLHQVEPKHLQTVILKMEEAGLEIRKGVSEIHVTSYGRPEAGDIETAPYPGFPTDLQQPFVAFMTIASGTSIVRETIFDRLRYVDELRRMGADIKVRSDTAIVTGVERLTGAPVEAVDLRAGAALVLAGLRADGVTEVNGLEIIERGYEGLETKLANLGADIHRIPGCDEEEGKDLEQVLLTRSRRSHKPGISPGKEDIQKHEQ